VLSSFNGNSGATANNLSMYAIASVNSVIGASKSIELDNRFYKIASDPESKMRCEVIHRSFFYSNFSTSLNAKSRPLSGSTYFVTKRSDFNQHSHI
jgi:hypothetical protein